MKLTISQVISVVCEYYGITPEELADKTRKRFIIEKRQLTHYMCREFTNRPLFEIGWQVGRKDHATVLHSIKQVNNLIETDQDFLVDVQNIYRILEGKIVPVTIERIKKKIANKEAEIESLKIELETLEKKNQK